MITKYIILFRFSFARVFLFFLVRKSEHFCIGIARDSTTRKPTIFTLFPSLTSIFPLTSLLNSTTNFPFASFRIDVPSFLCARDSQRSVNRFCYGCYGSSVRRTSHQKASKTCCGYVTDLCNKFVSVDLKLARISFFFLIISKTSESFVDTSRLIGGHYWNCKLFE